MSIPKKKRYDEQSDWEKWLKANGKTESSSTQQKQTQQTPKTTTTTATGDDPWSKWVQGKTGTRNTSATTSEATQEYYRYMEEEKKRRQARAAQEQRRTATYSGSNPFGKVLQQGISAAQRTLDRTGVYDAVDAKASAKDMDYYTKMYQDAQRTGSQKLAEMAKKGYDEAYKAGTQSEQSYQQKATAFHNKQKAEYEAWQQQYNPGEYYGTRMSQGDIQRRLSDINRTIQYQQRSKDAAEAGVRQSMYDSGYTNGGYDAEMENYTRENNRLSALKEEQARYEAALRYSKDAQAEETGRKYSIDTMGRDEFYRKARAGKARYEADEKAAADRRTDAVLDIADGREDFVINSDEYRKIVNAAGGFSLARDDTTDWGYYDITKFYAMYDDDPESAKAWLRQMKTMRDEQEVQAYADQYGQEWTGRVGAFFMSPAISLASGLDPYGSWGQKASRIAEGMQQGVTEGLTEHGLFDTGALAGEAEFPLLGRVNLGTFAGIGMSMLQSGMVALPAMAIGDEYTAVQKTVEFLGTALMGSSAAASDYREKLKAGWSETDALAHSLCAGIAEGFFEYFSLDKLVDQDVTRGIIKNFFLQGGVEASEEFATTVANRLSDAYYARKNGYDTSIEDRAKELVAQGYSYEGAMQEAKHEWYTELINDAFAGFVSGGGMTMMHHAAASVEQAAARKGQRAEYARSMQSTEGAVESVRKYAADRGLKEVKDSKGSTRQDARQGKSMQAAEEDIAKRMQEAAEKGGVQGANQFYTELVEKYGDGIRSFADAALDSAVSSAVTATTEGRMANAYSVLAHQETVEGIQDERAREVARGAVERAAYMAAMQADDEAQWRRASDYRRNHGQEMTMQATVTSEDGSERQVWIESVDTEDGTVKLAGGETVSFDSLIADPDTKDVVHAMLASDMTEEASARMIRTFQAQTAEGMVTDPHRWAMDYVTSYDRGRVGSFSLEKAQQSVDVLHADTVKIAYEAGQQVSEKLTQEQRDKLNAALEIREKGASGRAGSLDVGELAAKIEADDGLKAEVERIRKFAEVFGINVGLFESGVKNGRYQGENGRYQDGKIWLDINAGRNKVGDVARGMVQTMAHEMTHFMQEYSPEDYAGVKRFVMQQIAAQKGENAIKQLVDEKKQRHTGSKPISTTMAEDEIVADFCEDMLTDKAALETMAREDPKGFQALVQWIKDFMQKVFDKLAGRPAGSYEVQVYRSMEQSLRDAFGEAWGNGIVGAVQTHDIVGSLQEAERLGASAQMAEEATMRQSDRLDEETLEFLDNQEHVTVYRAMQLIDGQLYPPMAAKVEGKLVDPTEIGKWYQSMERPDLVKNGKFTLNKGNGTSVPAAYNPYFHCSASPLNDQFSSAYKRPNLVVVEGIIPKSELTSGYKAEGAKNSVGETQWHAGPVASKLKGAKARRVFLSRYFQVTRIMSDAEVAGIVAKTLQGENVSIPSNVVTPSLLEALKAKGVAVDETGIERFEGQHKKKNAPEGAKKQDREFEYMKPFAEQVDDFMDIKNRKKIFGRDGLLVGTTPTIMQDIGLIKMPVGIDQKHVKYVVDQAYRKHSKHPEYQLDHVFDVSEFKKLPEKISDPVAIIADPKTKNLTVFVEMINMGGKQTIVPFAIHDELSFGGQRIELQRIETVHGDNEAENMLRGAILNDSDDRIRIYYANAKKIPQGIREAAQVRGRPIPDGIIHRITDEGSIVKPAFTSITETTQFKRWFGDSKIVDKNGAPKIMYRGDANRITVFDRSKARSGMYGRGFYFTDSESHARQYGEASQYYLSVQKPLQPGDHKITKQQMLDFLEAVAANEDDYSFENYGQNATVDKVLREIYGKGDFEMLQDVNATAIGDFVETVELFNRICGTKYDGIVAPTETVVFDSKQIKSATENVGTFDRNNPDVRYQERDSFQGGANVEAVRDLIAVHNMTEQNIRDVLELGGFPSPSIAIVKAANGHTNYGPISVVFSRDSIDPALDKRNRIYGADAWTPTAANARTETEVLPDKRNRLDGKIWELSRKTAGGMFESSSAVSSLLGSNDTSYSLEEILERLANKPAVIAAYLSDKGIQVEPVMYEQQKSRDKWGDNMLKGMIETIGEDEWVTKYWDRLESGERVTATAEDRALIEKVLRARAEEAGTDFARRKIEARIKALSDERIEELLLHAWQYYRDGGLRESTPDRAETLEAMKRAIDPAHRIDGLLEEKIKKTVGDWLRPQVEEILGQKGIRNDKDMFTPSGSSRSFKQLHDAYTLENIVKAMNRASARGTNTFGISANSLQSVTAPEYRSISQVRADKGRLARVDDDTYKRIKADLDSEIADLTDEIRSSGGGSGNYYIDADIIGDVLIAGARGGWSAASIQRLFARESEFTISTATANKIRKLYQKAANLPTEYFEAKPQRAMGFDEIEAVILPSNMDHAIVQGLQDRGVSVLFFEPGNDAQRTEILNSLEDAKFQNRSYDAPSDMDLLDGFGQNDAENEEQRRLLREAQASGKKLREAQRQLERLRADLQALAGDNPSRITIKDFRRNVLDLFGIPSSERNGDIGNMIQSIAEGVLAGNKMSLEDISFFFQTFVENGTMRTVPNEYVSAIRDELKGRKIYVNDQVKEDLGEDYAALRKRAFGLGVTLTNSSKDMGIDQHWAELSEMYPGAFDSEELDLGTMLDQMISYAESGKASNVSILDGMKQVEEQTGEPVREQLQRMYDSFVRHIEIMEDRGKLEAKARAGNAAEVANAKKQAAKAREELSKIRKERNEWKKKATSAEKKAADKLQAELRKIVRRDAAQLAEAVRQKEALAKKLQQQVEREQKILTGKLNTPQLAKMLNAARETAAKEMAKHKDEVFARAKDRKRASELRSRIKNLHDEMRRELVKPREGHYVPQALTGPVLDLLEMISTDTGRAKSESAQAKIDAINAAYDRIRKDNATSMYYDETVKDMLTELSGTLSGRSIYDLNTDELADVYTVMKAMRTTIRNAIKADLIEKGKEIWEIGDEMRRELRAGQGAHALQLLEKYHMTMLSAKRAFNRFGGYRKGSTWNKVYRMLDDAQMKMLTLEMQGTRIFDQVLAGKENLRKAEKLTSYRDGDLVDIGLKDADGNAVPITRGMMLSLYMHLQNEENMRHLMYGGITLPDFRRYYKGNGEAWGKNSVTIPALGARIAALDELFSKGELSDAEYEEAYKEHKAEIDAIFDSIRTSIEESLTEYDRKWIAASREFFDGFSRQELNKVTLAMYGFNKARVENYFPIVTDADFLKSEFDSISKNISLENAGFMKERVRASNPIHLEDITKAVNRQISNVSRYAGLTQALKTFGNVYNVQARGFTDSVKKAMAKTFGKNGQQYVENLITDMVGGRNTPGSIFDRIKGNYAQAVLSANLSVTIKQAASFPTAAATVGWKPLMKALAKGGKKGLPISRADSNLISIYSPLLWYRSKGAIDVEIGDIANGRDWTQKAKWLMGWIEKTDRATVGRLWYAAEYYVKDHFKGLEKGTEAQIKNGESPFYRKVAEVFADIVEDTQPNYTILQRPDILRNPNKLIRAMVMFSTQRFQNGNILIDAIGEYNALRKLDKKAGTSETKAARKGARQKLTSAISSQVVSAMVLSAMTLLAGAVMHRMNPWRDDDDEITFESIAEEYLNGFLSSLAGSFLAGSEAYEGIYSMLTGSKYYGNDVGGISTINELATAVIQFEQQAVKLIGDEESTAKDWQNLAKKQLWKVGEYLSQMTGIPTANVIKILEGGRNHIVDAIEGDFLSFESGVERANKVNARRFIKAMEEGDTEKANSVMEEFRRNILNKKPGLKEEKVNQTIQNAITAYVKELYMSDELDEATATRYLVDYGSAEDENAAYWKIREWEAKADHAGDDEYTFNKYENLRALVAEGADISSEVKRLTDHGVKATSVNDDVKATIKDLFDAGKLSEDQVIEYLQRYHQTKDSKSKQYRPDTEDEAWETVQEWKAKQAHKGEEDYSWSKYEGLREAILSGGDVQDEVDLLVGHGSKEEDVYKDIGSTVKTMLTEGSITADQAEDLLLDYWKVKDKDTKEFRSPTENEVWAKVNAMEGAIEHSDEEDYSYGQYDEIDEAIAANLDIKALVKDMTDHGVKKDNITSHVKGYLIDRYAAGGVTETALKNQLARYCGITAKDDVEKILKDANSKKSYGVAYSSLDEEYRAGHISRTDLVRALKQYGGLSDEDANKKVRWYDLQKKYPDMEITEAWSNHYYEGTSKTQENGHQSASAAGMTVKQYVDAMKVLSKVSGTDANGDGKTDTNSKEVAYIAAIDAMNLTGAQKWALYYEVYKGANWKKIAKPSW